jgi:mannose-6-phosphate isomerase-like protein (cupin superfamily)
MPASDTTADSVVVTLTKKQRSSSSSSNSSSSNPDSGKLRFSLPYNPTPFSDDDVGFGKNITSTASLIKHCLVACGIKEEERDDYEVYFAQVPLVIDIDKEQVNPANTVYSLSEDDEDADADADADAADDGSLKKKKRRLSSPSQAASLALSPSGLSLQTILSSTATNDSTMRIQERTLWASLTATTSSPHYDQHHNVLTVVRGEKTVSLYEKLPQKGMYGKPEDGVTELLFREGWEWDCNHVSVVDEAHMHQSHSSKVYRKHTVVLKAGDSVYIPPGVVHEVTSVPESVGLGVWFDFEPGCEEKVRHSVSWTNEHLASCLEFQRKFRNFLRHEDALPGAYRAWIMEQLDSSSRSPSELLEYFSSNVLEGLKMSEIWDEGDETFHERLFLALGKHGENFRRRLEEITAKGRRTLWLDWQDSFCLDTNIVNAVPGLHTGRLERLYTGGEGTWEQALRELSYEGDRKRFLPDEYVVLLGAHWWRFPMGRTELEGTLGELWSRKRAGRGSDAGLAGYPSTAETLSVVLSDNVEFTMTTSRAHELSVKDFYENEEVGLPLRLMIN